MSTLPPTLAAHPDLDLWVRIDAADTITVFTGKVELGQGIAGALARVAADELDVDLGRVRVETADTDHGLDERVTAGSLSMTDSGSALRQAAAEVRAHLLELAAAVLAAPVERARGGRRHDRRAGGRVRQLLGARRRPAASPPRRAARSRPSPPASHRAVGSPQRNRSDLRGLVTGATRFVGDLRHDAHRCTAASCARRARRRACSQPRGRRRRARCRASSRSCATAASSASSPSARSRPMRAAELLARRARWSEEETLPSQATLASWLREQPAEAYLIVDGTPRRAGR